MTTLPNLQVLYRRKDDILFGWTPLQKIEAKSFNLYSSSTYNGVYTIVKTKIPNETDRTIYKGKVVCLVKDSEIPIPPNENIPPIQGGVVRGTTWWFKLTYVDPSNVESNIVNSPAIVVRPANVEPFFDNENEVQNSHNFGWIQNRHRWEKFLLTDDGKLIVDAQVTLANLKVAARPDGTTLEYLLVDNNRELIARLDPNSISRINDYEETVAVARNVEQIILTYTNPIDYFIEKVVCGGTCNAVFKIKLNGTTFQTRRNSWNRRDVTFDFSTIAYKISGGSTITVTAKHIEKVVNDFESSLIGFTFTI